jgi:hypothetical protein
MTKKTEHLEGAVEAFRRALAVYEAEAADGMAAVAEKNMTKAENLLQGVASRGTRSGSGDDRFGANDSGPPRGPNKRVSTAGR